MGDSAIVVVSGGMDSVTLAHWVREHIVHEDGEVHGISFNYGQRHKKELQFVAELVDLGVLTSSTVVDLTTLQSVLSASSLTNDDIDVPDGLYNEETMKATVVPNRNMIMLSIALGYAVTKQATAGVWTGVHGGDHFIYPDCRPDFISGLAYTAKKANEGFIDWINEAIHAPFISIGKHDIAEIGSQLGVDYSKTWSCYKGGEIHCGRCGTCTERKEAFRLAKVYDTTIYEDPEFKIQAYRGEEDAS